MAAPRTKWEEDNQAPLNPAAIAAAVVLLLVLAGLALLFALT